MWLESPLCHWCGKETFLSDVSGQIITEDFTATFDHLFSRLNPKLTKQNRNEGVLACYKCNNDRGRDEFRLFSIQQKAVRCREAHRYKGIKKPRCNNGNPCQTCLEKYRRNHEKENKNSD